MLGSKANWILPSKKLRKMKLIPGGIEVDLANVKLDLDAADDKVALATRRVEAAEEELARENAMSASSDAKLVRLQGIYDEFLKLVEGRASRDLEAYKESSDFRVVVALGSAEAYTQGWEDCIYAAQEFYQVHMPDPVSCTVALPNPSVEEAPTPPPFYQEEAIPAHFYGEAGSS